MKYLTFGPQKTHYKIAILVNTIRKDDIEKAYLLNQGINPEDVIVITLHQTGKKTPAAEMRRYIMEELTPVLTDLQIEYLFVTDSNYFKTITKVNKSDASIGYVLPSEYGPWSCLFVPNYQAIFYNPDQVKTKIAQGLRAYRDHVNGLYSDPGIDIIQYVDYPMTVSEIALWLQQLIDWDRPLASDIEAFSLKHHTAGIGTITFCWSKTEGIAFPVDLLEKEEDRLQVRAMLKIFYEHFNNTLIYHNIAYDVYVLIYQLFMNHILDTEGLLYGLEVMLKNWHDTKLISYLATNSCAGNKLSLKDQAQEYAGNYAVEDIKDIRKIPIPGLLQYNLVDGLSTWFVFEKHYDKMIADNQLDIYNNIFKPAIVDIIQMQLTGLPVDMKRVIEVKAILQVDYDSAIDRMQNSSIIQRFNYERLEKYVTTKNSEWKKKRTTVAEVLELAKTNETIRDEITFNPNSGPQLIKLLFSMLGLPVLALTDSKQPSTEGDVIKDLRNHTKDQMIIDFLDALIDFKAVDIILTTFIPAFEAAALGPDGWHYLFGNFNLGGTVSGRLSSSKPNLQNLPATGSKYAKLIKTCFAAPPGWFFCGIDFNSLEDRISALTTKDPNKLKVYTDGYDGHSLRAYAYFGDQMPDIDPNSVASINSIQKQYKELRQDSKVPTFSLTYAGTYITIMASMGWTEEKAKKVEQSYHELYKVSDEWVAAKLKEASRVGYATVAFGLRVRTPLLHQVILGTSKTPYEAAAEGRTVGNAFGQSWCLLNNRSGSEFLAKVRISKHRLDIRPCAQIHDAQYFLIKDDIAAIMFANEHIVKACQWQNHPDIIHPDVKLGGEFSIFYPDWSKEMGIPNNASEQDVRNAFEKHYNKLNKVGE